jgi:hypothetical protein
VLDATADHLPLPDGSGELRFYEHVLSQDPRVARTQRLVDRLIWPRAFGGCHTAGDTPAAVAAAGFSIEDQQALPAAPRFAVPVRLHVLGSARKI